MEVKICVLLVLLQGTQKIHQEIDYLLLCRFLNMVDDR